MIVALLTTLALANDPDFERLFGSTTAAPSAGPVAAPVGFSLEPFVTVLGLLAIGAAAWWLRKRTSANSAPSAELRVVARASLTAQNGLSVVEVKDGQGQWTRLLVADGPTPSLVADLGRVDAPQTTAEQPSFASLVQDEDEDIVPVTPTPIGDRAARARALVAEMAAAARNEDRATGPVSSSRPGAAARYREHG